MKTVVLPLVVILTFASASLSSAAVWLNPSTSNWHSYGMITDSLGGGAAFNLAQAEADAVARSYRGTAGSVISITSAGENTIARSLLPATFYTVLIGATDRDVEGTFTWTDGSPFAYSNWNGGEPNNVGEEDATVLIGGNGMWNDVSVNSTFGEYLIEYSNVTFGQIGPNGSLFELILTDTPVSWSQASSAAQGLAAPSGYLQGDLASIPDLTTINFMSTFYPDGGGVGVNDAWIGVNDLALEGTFVNADGSPLSFTNWNPGEPNNAGDEDFAEQGRAGGWNDLPASATRSMYWVEFKPVPEPSAALLACFALGWCFRRRR